MSTIFRKYVLQGGRIKRCCLKMDALISQTKQSSQRKNIVPFAIDLLLRDYQKEEDKNVEPYYYKVLPRAYGENNFLNA